MEWLSGDIQLHHGDARDIVSTLPCGLMVTDPPYNIGYSYDGYEDTLSDSAYLLLLKDTLRLPLVVIHYPEALFDIAQVLGQAPTKVVAWVYNSNFARQWRGIAWFGIRPDLSLAGQPYKNPTDKRIRQRVERGEQARSYDWWHIDQVKNVSREKTGHPCQIPLEVMKRILVVTPCDGPIIDPFCGSGTTLRAAKDLGLASIGIEQSARYIEITKDRLRQESMVMEVSL